MTYFSIKPCFTRGGRYILQLQQFYFNKDIISRSDVLVHLPLDTEWHWVPSAVWAPSTSDGGPSSRFYPSLWLAPREPEDSGCCQSPTCDERMLTMFWVSVLANRAGIRISSWHGCRAQAPVLVQILHGQTKSGVGETMEHFFHIFLKPEARSTAVVEASVGARVLSSVSPKGDLYCLVLQSCKGPSALTIHTLSRMGAASQPRPAAFQRVSSAVRKDARICSFRGSFTSAKVDMVQPGFNAIGFC